MLCLHKTPWLHRCLVGMYLLNVYDINVIIALLYHILHPNRYGSLIGLMMRRIIYIFRI